MYELIVGGCSGSNSPAYARPLFGHLTTSFGLLDRMNKRGIVIDNGTGVQLVSREMLKAGVVETIIVQTHFHSDHLEGLQLNTLLFGKTVQEIIVPEFPRAKRFEQIFAERFDPSAWPVSPKMFRVNHKITYFDGSKPCILKPNPWVSMYTLPLNHPGGCVGYRITFDGGQVIVIATDNELSYENVPLRRAYGEFVSGADILIADVQYTHDEYIGKALLGGLAMSRNAWGHSTSEMLNDTLQAFCRSWPKEIYATHHDPSRTDGDLHDFLCELRALNNKFSILTPATSILSPFTRIQ